jgi:SAM-dependent methyltransferase
MSIYSLLAPFYDAMNSEVDYNALAEYCQRTLEKHEVSPTSLVLDLGCGTGAVTIPLAKRGYDMIGIDLSPEMLTVARERAEKEGLTDSILFLLQDMTDFELYGTVEATVCALDGLNHLTSTADLEKTFRLVHNYLSPDGLFLFDMNTPYKFRTVYGDRAYLFEQDGAFCAWQNYYREKQRLCDFVITLFEEQEDGSYLRHEAAERERAYTHTTVLSLLKKTGFELISAVGDLDGSPVTPTTERIYYTARAKKGPTA